MTVVKAAAEAAAATEMPEPSAPPVVFGPVVIINVEKTFNDGNPDGGSHSSSEAAPSGGEDDHDGLTVCSDSDSRRNNTAVPVDASVAAARNPSTPEPITTAIKQTSHRWA